MFFVYILRSKKSDWHYIGQTQNLVSRIKQHNAGKTRSTKGYRPLDLVYYEVIKSREEALAREKYLNQVQAENF
ncbi:GIY-YIG nuclease family protein [Gilvimarinus agarilyticus]|nr:GIY-YIG nuclease family protein [Gilvimarinus agarilyticus]